MVIKRTHRNQEKSLKSRAIVGIKRNHRNPSDQEKSQEIK